MMTPDFDKLGKVIKVLGLVAAAAVLLAITLVAIPKLAKAGEPWGHSESYRPMAKLSCEASPLLPFTTDGCSMWPDGSWAQCCVIHDMRYWCGGSYLDRLRADADLARCVGGPLGWVMFVGVQAGGPSIFPTSFRWGYGWVYPRSGP